MNNAIIELNKRFTKIKKLGWMKSSKNGKGNIGLTLEELLGLTNNQFEIPDFEGIEIKTQRKNSTAYITLFSATPDGPHFHEVERLKYTYGYPHSKHKQYKVLNNSVFANVKHKIGLFYYFKLNVDDDSQKIFLNIFDLKGNLIENDVFWNFDTLKEKLYRKLKTLAFISADTKIIENKEYFKYNNMNLYTLKNFDTFIQLMKLGVIRVSFKISIFLSGQKKGKIHDHGTSFEILKKDLTKLYINNDT
jgi:hypothetical protein